MPQRKAPLQLIRHTMFAVLLLFDYFRAAECVKTRGINDGEGRKFERLTEASRPLVAMIASVCARQQRFSASAWCSSQLPGLSMLRHTRGKKRKKKKQDTSNTEEQNKMGCNSTETA